MLVYDPRTFLKDREAFERNTLLTRMSPNEERISSSMCLKTETDCDATLKRNREPFVNGETKNHEATQKNDDSAIEIEYIPRIKWLDLSAQIFIHAGCFYGLYLVFTQAKLLTTLWGKANFLGPYIYVYIFNLIALIFNIVIEF